MENNNLPRSSKKRELDQECTDAERQDSDPSERSASGIREPLDSSAAEPSPKRQKKLNEEDYFYELFQQVLDDTRVSKEISEEDVIKAIYAIKKSFSFENSQPVDYSQTDVICGYLSSYATHSAGLVRTSVVDAVRNCPELKSALGKEDELRVVSIGGGPGSDALGFCSALYELGLVGWTSLCITVVDAVKEWGECVTLVDKYLRLEEFGSASKLIKEKKVTMSFIQANLPGDPDKDILCYDAFKNADVIIECKVLFRLGFYERDRILQALHKTIKDDALVLPIHTPHYDQFWASSDWRFLYAPKEVKTYQLTHPHERFGHCDNMESTSQMRVLRKHLTRPTAVSLINANNATLASNIHPPHKMVSLSEVFSFLL